ncbi:FliH/SctL family protein [Agaribacter marinus]|uniref:Flagellar assembly protein FliH n=1 Tax=Agaribacter marinus TaxID=1431249 RepID=A0AA37WK80_9ALTE|nr:FliH/SctL family protein [Agaribacter marinus]GLR70730.1 flagellar assembly protein FliH [Agaribacter marinus]
MSEEIEEDIDFTGAKVWNLPSVDDALAKHEEKTDAFNRPVNRWQFEPPEGQDEDAKPLTAEQIEEIRQAAYQDGLTAGHKEGFDAGKTEGFEKGKEEGLLSGKEEGYQVGLTDASTDTNAQLANFENIIQQLSTPLQKVTTDVQKEVALLATALAKSIVLKTIEEDESIIIEAINKGLSALPMHEIEYKIYLNREDMATVETYLASRQEDTQAESQELGAKLKSSILQVADDVAKGGCKITTENNAVDMSIERRTHQVFSQVLQAQGIANDPRAD